MRHITCDVTLVAQDVDSGQELHVPAGHDQRLKRSDSRIGRRDPADAGAQCRSPSCRVRGDADARLIPAHRAEDRGVRIDASQPARSIGAAEPCHRRPNVSALPRYPPCDSSRHRRCRAGHPRAEARRAVASEDVERVLAGVDETRPSGLFDRAIPLRMSLVSRLAISVRIPAVSVRSWAGTSATPGFSWAAVTLVALLGELPRGVGDDFGRVAVDTAGGQLLGDRERFEQGENPYGRPESRTTMRCRLRETTSVIVAVQEPPRLSVMLIGVPRGSSASAATPDPSSTAPQASPSLQGFQPARGCLFGASRSGGRSRSSAAVMTSRAQALTLTCRSLRSRARRSRSSGSMRIWKTSLRRMT